MRLSLALVPLLAVIPARAEPVTPFERPPDSCGTQQIPGEAAPRPWLLAPGSQRTIYLNRFGGTYEISNAATDSAHNIASTRVSANGSPRTAMIPPLAPDFDWPMIAACVKEHFAPYNVRIVETEPSVGPYVEAVVGGTGSPLGFGASTLYGIAAADNFCSVTEAGIAFSFSEAHRGIPMRDAELCATIAHEVGHLLALEHEALAPDLMSYVLVSDTSSKSFVDELAPCGTVPQQPRNCSCSSGMTNSYARLMSAVGLRPVEGVAPTIELVSPGANGEVAPTFEVVVRATDDRAMSDVIALVDGVEVGGSAVPTGDEYRLIVRGIAEGPRALTVIARDEALNEAAVEVPIVVAKLPIGSSCLGDDACTDNVCLATSEGGLCSQACDVAAGTCPDGFACTAAGATAYCLASDSGGCCSVGSDGRGALLLGLGVGLVLLRSGRRRR